MFTAVLFEFENAALPVSADYNWKSVAAVSLCFANVNKLHAISISINIGILTELSINLGVITGSKLALWALVMGLLFCLHLDHDCAFNSNWLGPDCYSCRKSLFAIINLLMFHQLLLNQITSFSIISTSFIHFVLCYTPLLFASCWVAFPHLTFTSLSTSSLF